VKHKVLFVDDEPLILEGLKRALHKEPYGILTAGSAGEAYGILERERVDVVVSDDCMPGISGLDFFMAIRHKHPDIIRIMLTGRATLDAAVRAINEGEVYRFLIKPCDEVEVGVAVLQALRQKELVTETRKLLSLFKKQQALINRLENEVPQVYSSDIDEDGAVVIDDVPADLDINKLIEEIEKQTKGQGGST